MLSKTEKNGRAWERTKRFSECRKSESGYPSNNPAHILGYRPQWKRKADLAFRDSYRSYVGFNRYYTDSTPDPATPTTTEQLR